MTCIEYLEKEIGKVERSIKWAENKQNVKPEKLYNLNNKLNILNELKAPAEQHSK